MSPLDGLRAAGLDVAFAPGTLGHLRTAPARAPWLLRPDSPDLPGGSGVVPPEPAGPRADVRFYSPSGELIGSEQRDAAVFRWMNGFAAIGAPEQIDRLEVSCVIRATEPGTYQLGVTGIGRFRLLADEAVVFDETLTVREGADVGETLMAPPVRLAPLDLAAGQSVTVRLEHDVHTSPMAAFGTFFQFLLEAPHGTDDEEMEAAVALAASSDVAVVVVGTTAEVESEGFDRTSLALPGRQDELVRKVAAANPRTVVVVNSGAPVLLPWADEVAAVLLTWFGGQEFGNALADVLLGEAEPGGRLPTTWPASEDGLPSGATGRRRYSATPRACSSATAPSTATGASRCSRSAMAAATPPGRTNRSRWTATWAGRPAVPVSRCAWRCGTPAPGRAAKSSRSTRRARTRRSSARPSGWPASPPWTRTPARR